MKKRSKRVKENLKGFDKKKIYSLEEAIKSLAESKKAKFDETIEAHFNLNINPEKTEQAIRGGAELPFGTGKKIAIAVFSENQSSLEEAKKEGAEIVGGEELIEETAKKGSLVADVVLATPGIMPKLAKIARILGPRGIMPNPKSDTVTTDISKTIEKFKKGKITYKNDKGGNIHAPIGKISFSEEQLKENFEALKKSVEKVKPAGVKGKYIRSITLSSTMGLGLKIA